ncbi:hypothetical protein F444_00188 [Phytophthora nicotianae P1976]|uniref:Alpha-carbonic anhydrase domain-containing protein n=1 Tax=Phytophthora nicotianae P1976 TaxID=1317066 RepID=A0A081B547_PHYNI|nr:hypothetical protein F444_00188 [Phytophthora nicotianae P1976]
MDAVTLNTSQNLKLDFYARLIKTKLDRGNVYNYIGSLTTPLCDEIVDWWVVSEPILIFLKDLERLQKSIGKLPVANNGKKRSPRTTYLWPRSRRVRLSFDHHKPIGNLEYPRQLNFFF